MKAKIVLLSFCLLLSGCGQRAETDHKGDSHYEALVTDAPVAQVEGVTVSPDGRFEVRGEGESGEYISGIQPPEFLQIVNRQTGEILWQDQGWLWQSTAWNPSSTCVALAYAARTWNQILIIETNTWTTWKFTLPDGEPIPEYMFLPDAWGEWKTDNHLELTIGGGSDGESPHTYSCIVEQENGTISGRSWEFTKEILSESCDFNHDDQPETLELTTIWFPGLTDAAVDTYVLSVLDNVGTILWQDYAGTSHTGENSLYACGVDGADYLLRYRPYTQQGICTYHYELFSLGENGEEILFQENTVEFSADGSLYDLVGFDVPAIEHFLQEVHGYLDTGTLLVSTTPGDDLFFLDSDNRLPLMENLERYKEQIEASWQESVGT